MFILLLTKEVKNYLQTFKFSAALLTTFVLIIASVWVLGGDFLRRQDSYNTLSEKAAQRVREVYVPSRIQPILHRPPSPLSIFAQGEEKRLGNSVLVRRWEVPSEATDSLTDNMLLAADPPFDLLTIFTLVVSLFGIVLSYDAISGERERGTLKLLCTFRTSRAIIFGAKFVSGVLVLSLPFIISLLCALLILQFMFAISFTALQWLAIVLMTCAGCVFGAFFIAVGLCCSALVRRSSTSLVLSLLIWSLGVMIVPNAANSLASALTELQSPAVLDTFEYTMNEEIREKKHRFRSEHSSNPQSGWGSWNIGGETPFLFDGNPAQFADTENFIRYYEKLHQQHALEVWNLKLEHLRQKKRQRSMADILSFPAPAFHLRAFYTTLAATDYQAHADFMDRARRYREELMSDFQRRGFFSDNVLGLFSRRTKEEVSDERKFQERQKSHLARLNAGVDIWDVVGERNWDPLPRDLMPAFEHGEVDPRLDEAAWPFTVLVIMTALVFSVGLVAFIRYDIR